jgi:hypothetical protein
MIKRRKKKIGRNDPCPCGSGLKYKKCHGQLSAKPVSPVPEHIKAMIESHKANEARRQSQQGKGRPIISAEFQGYRFTAVGNRLHYAKTHKTFIDFLGDYIRSVLDPKWGNSEIGKPLEERHQILQWYDAICALQKETMKKPKGEIQDMPMNGLVAAYYSLAYNLYLLQHNAELQKYLIRRLKQHDSFYAAYYETYVAAWFILAGFVLRLEDEQDSTRTHPEFVATRDGKSYSVEAKTRQPGKGHFDVGNQLYDGLCIEAHHPRVIFIDMNVGENADFDAFRDGALAAIKDREAKLTIQGESAPPAHVYVTNQPYHLALNETSLPRVCISVGFKIPDFGYGAQFSSYTGAHKARMKYAALNDVQNVMVSYNIPATFDGEIPEIAFGEAERKFTIGERLEVAGGIFVTLRSGAVAEQEKKAYLVVSDDNGNGHIMTAELSDAEIAAYRSHPDTFFGRIMQVPKKTEDPMDLYTFFLDSFKKTPRERLLELMGEASDIEELKKLSEDELRYTYAERLTHWAMREKKK